MGTDTSGDAETTEQLPMLMTLIYYCRVRFIQQLLPLLRASTSLSRVVNVFAGGGCEGAIDVSDFPGRNVPLRKARGHASSMQTVALEHLQLQAPDVSFLHVFPGTVFTPILNHMPGVLGALIHGMMLCIRPFWFLFGMDIVESGEWQTFLSTCAQFPSSEGGKDGLPVQEGEDTAKGTNGQHGSGVYTVNFDGKTAGVGTVRLLEGFRADGTSKAVWEHTTREFERIGARQL